MHIGTPGAIVQPPAAATYLGQGVSYPLAFNPNTGRLNLSSGAQSVAESLQSLLQTQPAERVMQPDYGCDVGTFEVISQAGKIQARLYENIASHEPRVTNVEVLADNNNQTQGEQALTIRYQIAGQATTQTLTYPSFVGPTPV